MQTFSHWSQEPVRPPRSDNQFQAWAHDYARAFGFIVSNKGNWVELTKDGKTVECMSVLGVQAVCATEGK